jgi:hypothetical protein
MTKFKVGDKVRVKYRDSTDSRLLNNRIGIIVEVKSLGFLGTYVILDIESELEKISGIWVNEIELVESVPKVIDVYGIVKFCKEYYK